MRLQISQNKKEWCSQ